MRNFLKKQKTLHITGIKKRHISKVIYHYKHYLHNANSVHGNSFTQSRRSEGQRNILLILTIAQSENYVTVAKNKFSFFVT